MSAPDRAETASLSPVNEADALDDRADGRWFVRRHAPTAHVDIYVRRSGRAIATGQKDDDGELAPIWCQAAYPYRRIQKVGEWVRKAIKKRGG